jgi:hypothetical protein
MPLPRRRRRHIQCDVVEKLDLHDYALCGPDARCAAHRSTEPIRVSDDWPEIVPITDTEIRVIEGHLGDELDALFGPIE